jgi:hypothetical protein
VGKSARFVFQFPEGKYEGVCGLTNPRAGKRIGVSRRSDRSNISIVIKGGLQRRGGYPNVAICETSSMVSLQLFRGNSFR